LIVRQNKIKDLVGPFEDMAAASEKQVEKEIMKL